MVEKSAGIYTSYVCNNDELFKNVTDLYFKDGFVVADITWGRGVFWKQIDTSKYKLYKSDMITCPDTPYDFTNLPKSIYKKNKFDVVVFDPPYAHNPGKMMINASYKNSETTKNFYHKDIVDLYKKGMSEAVRILKPDGFLMVKCKDEIESSKQMRSHIEIWDIATKELDMIDRDLFVLTQISKPVIQYATQKHARKNNSFLWVFQKKEK